MKIRLHDWQRTCRTSATYRGTPLWQYVDRMTPRPRASYRLDLGRGHVKSALLALAAVR